MNVYRYCNYICKQCFSDTELCIINSRPHSVRRPHGSFAESKGNMQPGLIAFAAGLP